MERYEILKDIGSGNFGVARLVRDRITGELYAVKFIERGNKIGEHVQREIMNHRALKHPNIVLFKEQICHRDLKLENTLLDGSTAPRVKICDFGHSKSALHSRPKSAVGTPAYIAPEVLSTKQYDGKRILTARYSIPDTVRVSKECKDLLSKIFVANPEKQICHRDLKLENTLLDGSTAPRVKICDFGYSKSLLQSQPKSTVGTPAYIAPEIADVWSCGVTLYVMIVGAYPFEDPKDPRNFRKTIGRILSVQYSVPDNVLVSIECRHLLSHIFVANPEERITIPEIKSHPWFLKNLPMEMMEGGSWQCNDVNNPWQSVEEVLSIIQEARKPLNVPNASRHLIGSSSMDVDDFEAYVEDIETSGDFVLPNMSN
ncbi:hypothetical protein C1H46_001672 [Malus baccata]|uniref:non-specific serine/threonine protein kinase n=1 Tax=Malus baccata TaxID=106549 RepID=A0A540NNP3_MALBA|nr:hypothetical protein C1H46_001672 [Malus baccata]